MGGATSIDKQWRLEDAARKNNKMRKYGFNKLVQYWWEQEQPTEEEIKHALCTLEKYNYKTDYIITHTASKFIMEKYLSTVIIDVYDMSGNVYE